MINIDTFSADDAAKMSDMVISDESKKQLEDVLWSITEQCEIGSRSYTHNGSLLPNVASELARRKFLVRIINDQRDGNFAIITW